MSGVICNNETVEDGLSVELGFCLAWFVRKQSNTFITMPYIDCLYILLWLISASCIEDFISEVQ